MTQAHVHGCDKRLVGFRVWVGKLRVVRWSAGLGRAARGEADNASIHALALPEAQVPAHLVTGVTRTLLRAAARAQRARTRGDACTHAGLPVGENLLPSASEL